jgi:hypothetical protein
MRWRRELAPGTWIVCEDIHLVGRMRVQSLFLIALRTGDRFGSNQLSIDYESANNDV